MSKLLVVSFCFAFSSLTFSCSNNSTGNAGTALSAIGSCSNEEQKLCKELYTTTFIQQYKTACSDSEGTFSATTGCKAAGRVKGCQASLQGVKTYTDWGYDETSAGLVEGICNLGASNAEGATYTVVNP